MTITLTFAERNTAVAALDLRSRVEEDAALRHRRDAVRRGDEVCRDLALYAMTDAYKAAALADKLHAA